MWVEQRWKEEGDSDSRRVYRKIDGTDLPDEQFKTIGYFRVSSERKSRNIKGRSSKFSRNNQRTHLKVKKSF